MTGDIEARINVPLALLDSFTVAWCDAPNNCANAANGLILSGESIGRLGSHKTPRGINITLEVDDRFLYVSPSELDIGDCTVTFTVADQRGYRGRIACSDISNGVGLGVLTISVRGTFAAAF